jgi:surface protein
LNSQRSIIYNFKQVASLATTMVILFAHFSCKSELRVQTAKGTKNKASSCSGDVNPASGLCVNTNSIQTQTINELESIKEISGALFSKTATSENVSSITYECAYDQSIDATVAAGNPCSALTGVEFNSSTGAITWKTNYFSAGTYEFKITVIPTTINFTTITGVIVKNANRAPQIQSLTPVTVTAGSAITTIDLNDDSDDLDRDLEKITYSCYYDRTVDAIVSAETLCSNIQNFNFSGSSGILNWTPITSQSGSYEIKVVASDGELTDSKIFTITVSGTNHAPALDAIANQTVTEGTAITTVNASDSGDDLDSDGDPITYSCYYDTTIDATVAATNLCTTVSGLSFNTSTGVMDWTPSYSQSGNYEFKIIGSDGSLSDSKISTITVNDYNPPPTISFTSPLDDDDTVVAMTYFNITFTASDSNDVAAISLYRNTTNTNCTDGSLTGWTLITNSLVEGTHTSYNLSTTALESTTQYFCLKITDGTSTAYAVSGSLVITSVGSKFVSTWKTDNAGTSTSTQITLPLSSSGSYNFLVDWGDYTQNTITAYNDAANTHTYATAGTYTVTITGTITGWYFNNTGDRLKMLSLTSWGPFKFGTVTSAFFGAANLVITATDSPNLTGTTSFYRMFYGTTSMTGIPNINTWNVSSITNMQQTFSGSAFNSNIGSWDVSHVTTIYGMFSSNTSFNQDISGWVTSSVTGMSSTFVGATAFNQNIGTWNTSSVTDMRNMFQSATAFNQNIGSWNVSAVTQMDNFLNAASAFNQNIGNWDVSHVTSFTSFFTNATAFNQDISSWNITGANSLLYMFYGATSFNQNIGSWNTSNITNMGYTFASATSFAQNLNGWNTSNVTNMNSMFSGATVFNSPLNSWDVSKVTNFASMFKLATTFNQPLSSWNTAAATNMSGMFDGATSFNQDISSFNTALVTNMASMFSGATAFNQSLNSWNTASVTNMDVMFNAATSFNGNITSWNTSSVTTLNGTFRDAVSFNQNISGWNTASVTNMTNIFYGATSFNANISSWNTAAVTNMTGMFTSATSFNQNIGTWNTSSVTNMSQTFYNATSFNQDITGWNTSLVTTMSMMFRFATGFNQDVSKWNYGNVTTLSQFLNNMTLSTRNFDDLLISLANQTTANSVTFGGGSSKYSSGTAATKRAYLIATKGWTITDGGADTGFPTTGSFSAASGITQTMLTINWTAATDTVTPQANLEYYVCSGASAAAIDTSSECLAATQLMGWTANITNFNQGGLSAGTTYYYNVLVRDGSSNIAAYDTTSVTTSP